MELTNIREIFRNKDKFADKEVTIGGWVRSNRNSKNFGKINVGAAIIVRGTLVLTPDAKQPFEIQAAEVTVEGASTPDYPLQKKRHTFEYLRTISHLRPRTNTFEAVFRVRSLTNSSRRGILCTCTHRLSQEVTVRVQERCSR